MSESAIRQFMEIAGVDHECAISILKLNNNSLEQAINYHLESESINNENNIYDSSVSENALLPNCIENNDNIRAPIAPIREQLIQPDNDQFNYPYNNIVTRKRRLIPATFSVCPLRNFAREAEQQETEFNTNNNNDIIKIKRNNLSQNNNLQNNNNENESKLKKNKKCLEDLFRPPSDILFLGTFKTVREHSTNLNRWLIVNLQDNYEFQSQILNRDIWPDSRIRDIISTHFILYQISLDNPEGIRFKTFYRVDFLPYVCILDPRTGENKLICNTNTPSKLHKQLIKFLEDNSYKLNSDDESINKEKISNDIEIINYPSTSTNNIKNLNNNKNDIKDTLLELSEQDQLNLAIKNSLKEKCCTITSNSNNIDTDDDNYDDDDDTNDSSNNLNNNEENNLNKIKNNDDIIKTELFNITEQLTKIQIRLPFGDRECIELPSSTLLDDIIEYVKDKYPIITKNQYKLISRYPLQNILELNNKLNLIDAKLHPSAVLYLHSDD